VQTRWRGPQPPQAPRISSASAPRLPNDNEPLLLTHFGVVHGAFIFLNVD
jgi:hypothetical protein